MPQKIQVRVTGNRGQTDGYVESIIGIFVASGMLLKRPKFNLRKRPNEQVSLYVTMLLKDVPLGHLGEQDFIEQAFTDGEIE